MSENGDRAAFFSRRGEGFASRGPSALYIHPAICRARSRMVVWMNPEELLLPAGWVQGDERDLPSRPGRVRRDGRRAVPFRGGWLIR